MQELAEVEMTWLEKAQQKGREEGLLEGQKKILLRLLRAKFGDLPAVFVARIEAIRDTAVLDELSEQILTVTNLTDLNLPEAS